MKISLISMAQRYRKAGCLSAYTNKGKSIMVQTTMESFCPCIGKSMIELSMGGSITVTSIERDG